MSGASDDMRDAIKAAIACLERITYEDDGRREVSFVEGTNLNDPRYGNVQSVIDKLRAAIGEGP